MAFEVVSRAIQGRGRVSSEVRVSQGTAVVVPMEVLATLGFSGLGVLGER